MPWHSSKMLMIVSKGAAISGCASEYFSATRSICVIAQLRLSIALLCSRRAHSRVLLGISYTAIIVPAGVTTCAGM